MQKELLHVLSGYLSSRSADSGRACWHYLLKIAFPLLPVITHKTKLLPQKDGLKWLRQVKTELYHPCAKPNLCHYSSFQQRSARLLGSRWLHYLGVRWLLFHPSALCCLSSPTESSRHTRQKELQRALSLTLPQTVRASQVGTCHPVSLGSILAPGKAHTYTISLLSPSSPLLPELDLQLVWTCSHCKSLITSIFLTLSVCPSQEDSGAKNALKKTNASIICFIPTLPLSATTSLRSGPSGIAGIREALGCLAQAKSRQAFNFSSSEEEPVGEGTLGKQRCVRQTGWGVLVGATLLPVRGCLSLRLAGYHRKLPGRYRARGVPKIRQLSQ